MTEKVKIMWKREEMMEKAIELTQNAQTESCNSNLSKLIYMDNQQIIMRENSNFNNKHDKHNFRLNQN